MKSKQVWMGPEDDEIKVAKATFSRPFPSLATESVPLDALLDELLAEQARLQAVIASLEKRLAELQARAADIEQRKAEQ